MLYFRQFMAKSRTLVYCWSVNYSPGAAHCVATAITSVHFFQPSTAVQFIQSIQQHTVSEPVIML